MKKHIPLVLAIYVAFVFLQSLVFKFAGWFGSPADITVYIFQTVGQWMREGLGLTLIGDLFGQYGETVIGLAELIASILILRKATRLYGALLGLGIMSGAIFFHIFTPLGLFPYTDLSCLQAGCPREYPLFFMAVGVWLSCAYLIYRDKHKLIGPV
ncbi:MULTISPECIES: hypothetical protein [unclassified Agarivorans]|uniref:hypothetical protein n=1 Tax=unclassified Agarivorans TaxID=2636026 RepID=UPI0010D1971D|nr:MULTISPECIES: hypothetical protein [unclassified Agarivorans]MDO6685022.1 hypothetical protein [Agarivorans sp. 3_MG-2023]MDO6717420.1 hypothetical protein [Agarivorans sp. 2_MG-2023]GDY28181.1 hypothetical protein AHAT_40710 [Agarivorans sp. Toyoura001]